MSIKSVYTSSLLAGVIGVTVFLGLAGCSGDDDKSKATKHETISHELLTAKVTDDERQKFEHDFERQCIDREVKQASDKAAAENRFKEPCRCIATFMMKDLTAIEAEKFLQEHENAQSLRIKYENAAFHCLQQKAHPKGPNFSRP